MYGGVSLAIYTYGVSRELADLVQERTATYRALKALLASDVVVDIVSGTSAGGVNGVLLGRALATGGSIEPCAELWREKADLLLLLDEPLLPVKSGEDQRLRALFRSREAYELELEQALQKISDTADPKRTNGSRVRELDVFLTGTDLAGRVWTELDGRQKQVDVKDHRVVFHLKHRDGRKSAFVSDDQDEARKKGLAAIARVTSAFPVAFHPVRYRADGKHEGETLYQDLMRQTIRGQWKDERHFIDGGVLDNKPFSHALRPILFRATDRPVERKIFYVDPDPEQFGKATVTPDYTPDQIAIAALTKLPAYESIADDLEQIRAHNRRVQLIGDMLKSSSAGVVPDEGLYHAARAAGVALAIEEEIADAAVVAFGDRQLRELHEAIVEGLKRDPEMLDGIDVFREQRRHLHAIYEVYGEMKETESIDPEKQVRLEFLYEQLEKLEVIEHGLRRLVRNVVKEERKALEARDKGPFLDALVKRANEYLCTANHPAPELYAALDRRLRGAAAEAISILLAIKEQTTEMIASISGCWRDFDNLDKRVYPLQSASQILEKDLIELIRISPFDVDAPPIDGKNWGLPAKHKISGDALFHFGGFIKQSWRSNDIYWGRSDASGILIDSLVDEKRLGLLAASGRLHECVEAAIAELKAEGIASDRDIDLLRRAERSPAELSKVAKAVLTSTAAREIFLSTAPDVAEDRALDTGLSNEEVRRKRASVRDELKRLKSAGKLGELEALGQDTVHELGEEDLRHVAPERVLRLASQTSLLLLRMLKYRFEAAGAKARLVGNLFVLLERIAMVAYVLGRAMELGLRAHALMLIVIGALLLGSVVTMVLAWSPDRSPLWPLALIASLTAMFVLVRSVLVKRLEAAGRSKRAKR
jgi:predicted acylesterase/phospholipase RssA